jgi:hypothetical protein
VWQVRRHQGRWQRGLASSGIGGEHGLGIGRLQLGGRGLRFRVVAESSDLQRLPLARIARPMRCRHLPKCRRGDAAHYHVPHTMRSTPTPPRRASMREAKCLRQPAHHSAFIEVLRMSWRSTFGTKACTRCAEGPATGRTERTELRNSVMP